MNKKTILLVLLTSYLLIAGCNNNSNSGGGGSCTPSTPGGPGTPEIQFTSVPPKGSFDKIKGLVRHVQTDQYKVAVYIHVIGGWWNKPSWANPTTSINNCNGSWECAYVTGGVDQDADQIVAYLIPASYTPPRADGNPTIPGDIEQKALSKVQANR